MPLTGFREGSTVSLVDVSQVRGMYQHGGDDGLRVAVTGARASAEPVLASTIYFYTMAMMACFETTTQGEMFQGL